MECDFCEQEMTKGFDTGRPAFFCYNKECLLEGTWWAYDMEAHKKACQPKFPVVPIIFIGSFVLLLGVIFR